MESEIGLKTYLTTLDAIRLIFAGQDCDMFMSNYKLTLNLNHNHNKSPDLSFTVTYFSNLWSNVAAFVRE